MSHESLFHLSAKAVIQNNKGEVLLLRALPHEMKSVGIEGSYWDIPGGRISKGEKPEEALVREVQEEVGLALSAQPELLVASLTQVEVKIENNQTVGVILFAYLCQIEGEQVPILSTEHDSYAWEKPEEAAQLLSANFPQPFIEKLRQL